MADDAGHSVVDTAPPELVWELQRAKAAPTRKTPRTPQHLRKDCIP
jgi:hypothetical protein